MLEPHFLSRSRTTLVYGLRTWSVGLLACALAQPLALAAPDQPPPGQIDTLVAQLGSPRFIERQIATEALSSMGQEAKGAVLRAKNSTDPEVVKRAEQILLAIRLDGKQRVINAFIAGEDVEAEGDLPLWAEYQAIAGTSAEAKQLFVQMLEEEWSFLDMVAQGEPRVVSNLLAARVVALEAAIRDGREKRGVSVGSVATLLLVAAGGEVQLPNQANLMSLCYRSQEFETAMRAGSAREPLRALMGKLIAKDTGGPYLTQRFHFALHYDLKEGLTPARQVLAERQGIAHVRLYAILVVGKLGDEQDLKLIGELLDDAGVVSSHNRVNKVRITTEVRDVALAVLIHRSGGNFADYGLPDIKSNPTTLMQTSSIGFPSEEERLAAIAKWRSQHDATPPTPEE
jgi:hypothetical protein